MSKSSWMDQDATWYGCRPRPRPHCVRWGPSSPPLKGAQPHFLAHVYCDQTAGWIKMPLGTELGLGSGHMALDGDPAPLPSKKGAKSPNFRPMSIVAKRLDGSRCHLSTMKIETFGHGPMANQIAEFHWLTAHLHIRTRPNILLAPYTRKKLWWRKLNRGRWLPLGLQIKSTAQHLLKWLINSY